MTQKPYLIFDAGGVLIFPNFELLSLFGNQAGIETSASEIAQQHALLFHSFDEHIARHHQFPSIQYFLDLFNRVTDSNEKAQMAVNLTLVAEKEQHLWATTRPWVGETLQKLNLMGYQMAVISNSEGQVEEILHDLNLREYFEIVIDSFVVGVEKPDPQIFEIALERLGWDRNETIYIGDLFYVDVWGANRAGLGAIHIDKLGLYPTWDGIHIPSIQELPGFLYQNSDNLQDLNLFPAQDFTLN